VRQSYLTRSGSRWTDRGLADVEVAFPSWMTFGFDIHSLNRYNCHNWRALMHVAMLGNILTVRPPKTIVDRLRHNIGDDAEIVATEQRRLTKARDDSREQALARMTARKWPASANCRFDRDEANHR